MIAGDGKVGATLMRQLSAEGYDVTIIDSDQEVLDASVEQYDVMAVCGNCASMEVLEQARIRSADLLIAATSADEVNLLCCLTAHGMNPRLHTIARIRNPEYSDQIYEMRDIFALSLTVNPERQAAVEIERLLQYPGFLKRDTFAKGRVEIVELKVDTGSKLCDVSLREMDSIVRCKVLVAAVLRDGGMITPYGDFVLREGDRVFVTAPTKALTTLLRNIEVITHKAKRVLLVGGGRVSFYLAQRLQKDGIAVQLIERDAERCRYLAAQLPAADIVHGDASNPLTLEQEGLEDCDALVTLTGLDELNMVLSLYGNRCGIPQIITKLSRDENSSVFGSLPVGSIICPKKLCCNSIVRYVRAIQNQTGAAVAVHSIADGQAEAMEFRVDETTPHSGELLKDLRLRRDVLIVCIIHGSRTEIPDGNSSYSAGDTLIIVTSQEAMVHQIGDIFQ